ncbi:MAG: carbamoyltransferase HypF [bacterium]
MTRLKIKAKGIVQGVGFRPFIYKTAHHYKLTGFVKNTSSGVEIEVQGDKVEKFVDFLKEHHPPLAKITKIKVSKIPSVPTENFVILESEEDVQRDVLIPPDIAICEDCYREFNNPENRRFHYPFINCTNCGPRFTIITDIPYDRPFTTMKDFEMCDDCHREYTDPNDRRYHAQPVSCFKCGPQLKLLNNQGISLEVNPVAFAGEMLLQNKIIAIKGLGGFHLACLADKDQLVLAIRKKKQRGNKPLAVMASLNMIQHITCLREEEQAALTSPSAPIVILKVPPHPLISKELAPGLDSVGFILPYTPLHLLLFRYVDKPLVMTSANLSHQPIMYKQNSDLLALADYVLTHDRQIHSPCDDSVVKIFNQQPYFFRRSRGYVPQPITLSFTSPKVVLGLGPMLNNTFCMLVGNQSFPSQYLGTTDNLKTLNREQQNIDQFCKMLSVQPHITAVDKHPNFPNRKLADNFPQSKLVEIQHHRAHIASLLAELQEDGPVIGIAMDGTGFGDDRKIWGGEFFMGSLQSLERVGQLKYYFLPTGETAIHQPWRYALSLLHSLYGNGKPTSHFADKFTSQSSSVLDIIKKQNIGVFNSSCGRLFDAVASLLGIGHYSTYRGELPSVLQGAAERVSVDSKLMQKSYNYSISFNDNYLVLDMLPAIGEIIEDKIDVCLKAFYWHFSLAKALLDSSKILREHYHLNKVGLSGGVFQNTLLLEMLLDMFNNNNFEVLIHRQLPPNDSCISLGQAVLAAKAEVRS